MSDVLLTPDTEYVMFLDTSSHDDTDIRHPLLAAMGMTRLGYADGDFWYQNSNKAATNVFSYSWTCGDEGNGCRDGDAGAGTPTNQASKRLRNA